MNRSTFIERLHRIKQAPFHEEWQTAMDTSAVIVAPRGHGLTTEVVARLAWEAEQNPEVCIGLVMPTILRAEEAREYLTSFAGKTLDIRIWGMEQRFAALPDILVLADLGQHNPKTYEMMRKFTEEWKPSAGRTWLIGTPKHPQDLLATVYRKAPDTEFSHWGSAALVQDFPDIDRLTPLWPEQWPIEKLRTWALRLGKQAFQAEFMLKGIV